MSPFKRERYPADWDEISARIRERAGDKCEFCSVPNHALIVRNVTNPFLWQDANVEGEWMEESEWDGPYVNVVLTVAHMDHDTTNNTDGNLRALCQRCHLTYDAKHHARNAANTRRQRRIERGQQELIA